MITIIDYGLGNIKAFANLYERLNVKVKIAKESKDLIGADKIILPGVGSFDYAMTRLEESGMKAKLNDLVLVEKIPILGVCVGMQMMGNRSDEGELAGLGWIDGEVKLFDKTKIPYKTKSPHMGWNNISPQKETIILNSLNEESRFYFLHSYYFKCNNEENVLATSEYGEIFACVINKENIYGVQFHPEKSHKWGEQVLRNFERL